MNRQLPLLLLLAACANGDPDRTPFGDDAQEDASPDAYDVRTSPDDKPGDSGRPEPQDAPGPDTGQREASAPDTGPACLPGQLACGAVCCDNSAHYACQSGSCVLVSCDMNHKLCGMVCIDTALECCNLTLGGSCPANYRCSDDKLSCVPLGADDCGNGFYCNPGFYCCNGNTACC